ncbi:MAG: hypothetical protein HC933_21780 [Pleurocapsa sp. SU_196_0]|nr:hypothetical protein [Pleurocapsa sp. SU_196_0]
MTTLKAVAPMDRELRIHLPDEIQPGDELEIQIRSTSSPTTTGNVQRVLETLDRFRPSRYEGVSRDELDRQIQAERDAWE